MVRVRTFRTALILARNGTDMVGDRNPFRGVDLSLEVKSPFSYLQETAKKENENEVWGRKELFFSITHLHTHLVMRSTFFFLHHYAWMWFRG
jgi:hypothetical protein